MQSVGSLLAFSIRKVYRQRPPDLGVETRLTKCEYPEHRVRHWELKDILDQQDQQMEMLSRQIGDVHVQSEALFSHADWRGA